jgi:hypothetical protein
VRAARPKSLQVLPSSRDLTGVSGTDPTEVFAAAQLHLHDQVRLVTAHGDVREGSIGRILGRFARPSEPTFFVAFDGQPAALEVSADALELHGS